MRKLLSSVALVALVGLAGLAPAMAETPKDTLVMAKAIDDMITAVIPLDSLPEAFAASLSGHQIKVLVSIDAGRFANGASRAYAALSAAVRPSRVMGNSIRACRAGARRVISVASFISAIGVMPAIASVGNAPMEYETAPINRPSM